MRIAILGIGSELNGDDAAGVLAARALRRRINTPDVLVIDAGPSPESFTGPLRRFAPEWVILVDAAEMGEAPGGVAWVNWDEAQGWSGSTHAMPPTVLAEFLMRELGCKVTLVGIQPVTLAFDSGVSPVVRRAVQRVVTKLLRVVGRS